MASSSQYQFQNVQPSPSGYQPQSQYQVQVVQSQHSQAPLQQADAYQPQRNICNPCGCWCCTCCNLRVNCFVISALLIVVGIWYLTYGVFVARPASCEDAEGDYLETCLKDLGQDYDGRISSPGLKHFNDTRAGMLWAFILISALIIPAAGSLLAAIFVRKGFLTVVAAVLILVSLLPYFYYAVCQYDMYARFYHIALYKDVFYTKESDKADGAKVGKPAVIVGALFGTGLYVYYAVCCFQFRKQINAKVDRQPHSPPCGGRNRNMMFADTQPAPMSMAPPAYSSTATYHTPSQMNTSYPPQAPPGYVNASYPPQAPPGYGA